MESVRWGLYLFGVECDECEVACGIRFDKDAGAFEHGCDSAGVIVGSGRVRDGVVVCTDEKRRLV